MRGLWVLGAALLVAALPASVEAQFFTDNFDSYATGSTIMGQGGWETWGNVGSANTTVTNAQAYSPANSLLVAGPADIVHQFAGVNSGIWYAKAMTYVPSTQTGEMYFILLNTYPTGTANNEWSVQVALCRSGCTSTGVVPGMVVNLGGSEFPGMGSRPLITNQWVEVRAEVNFTTNQYSIYYDNVLFDTQSWTSTGFPQLAAMDLFSNGSTESYMDDIWLDTTVPVELMSFTAD